MGDYGNKRDDLEYALKEMKSYPENSLGWYVWGREVESAVFAVLEAQYFTVADLQKMGVCDPHFWWEGDEFAFNPPCFDHNQILIQTGSDDGALTSDPTAQIYQGGCI